MFFDVYRELCATRKKTPNGVAKELGFPSSSVTQWKKGSTPRPAALQEIADYFGVSVSYLLGAEQKENPTDKPGEVNTDNISELLEKMTTPDLIDLLGEITKTLKRRDEK